MKSHIRWIGLYLLHLLAATFGIGLATAILLNAILKPLLGPLLGVDKLVSIATGPYYLLEIILAALAGYFSHIRFKGHYRFWVWVLPTVYLLVSIILWKPASVMGDHSLRATLAHFFTGSPPHYPEGSVTVPFFTSLSYSFGALLDAGKVFRFHPIESVGN